MGGSFLEARGFSTARSSRPKPMSRTGSTATLSSSTVLPSPLSLLGRERRGGGAYEAGDLGEDAVDGAENDGEAFGSPQGIGPAPFLASPRRGGDTRLGRARGRGAARSGGRRVSSALEAI